MTRRLSTHRPARNLPWRATLLATLVLVSAALGPARAETQRLRLGGGWNLVSFAVEPADPAPAAVLAPLGADLLALWSYDAASGVWARFPQPTPGAPTITAIESGRGYWLEVTRVRDLDVVGLVGTLPRGPDVMAAGWNLVGFPLVDPAAYERVLANAAIRQVWTLDRDSDSFEGIVIDASGLVVREDFVQLEPGQGYWIFATEETSLAPVLETTLPADVDLPPLFDENPPVDEALPWTTVSQGDVDVGRDGFYDRPLTQRAVDFEDRILQHQLVVANAGVGVLRYRVRVDDPESCGWLRFQVLNRATGETELVSEVEGALSTERAFHVLAAHRAGLAQGDYDCGFSIESNGVVPVSGRRAGAGRRATEPGREFSAAMTVGGLEGDYRLRVEIDTIDGKLADLANPRITLSLYGDSDGLNAIVDPRRTLLFPSDLHLAGRLVETDSTRFELNGSFETPPEDPGNPFSDPVRRDVTLRGSRSDRAGLGGPSIGSPDLEGEYYETLRGIGESPIRLVGTFTGERLGSIPSVRDRGAVVDTASIAIPDDGLLERVITLTDRILVDEVDVTTTIAHSRATDLVVSLLGPTGVEVVLRDRSGADLGTQIFDEFHVPLESLEAFDGLLAAGDWTLRIVDEAAGETGDLLSWGLDVRGTRVHDIAGSVAPGLPAESTVILTGCGRTEVVTTEPDRTFRFEDLIDCVYRVQVDEVGFQVVFEDVVLMGADVEGVLLDAPPGTPVDRGPIVLPESPQGVFVALTTEGAAGRREPFLDQQYGIDSATWDLDRAPLGGTPQITRDSDAFLGRLGIPDVTGSNAVGTNGVLDGPVGPNSARIFVNIGMPVIGRSVQGGLILEIGGRP